MKVRHALLALLISSSAADAQNLDLGKFPCSAFMTYFAEPALLNSETVALFTGLAGTLKALGKGDLQTVTDSLYVECVKAPKQPLGEAIYNAFGNKG